MYEEDGGCLAVIVGGILMVCLVAAAFGKLPLWIWVLVGALIVTAIVGGALFIYTEFAPTRLRRRVRDWFRRPVSPGSGRRDGVQARPVDWRRLSERSSNADVRHAALHEGVPDHLRSPLVHWIECQLPTGPQNFHDTEAKALRIATRARLDLSRHIQRYHDSGMLHRTALIKVIAEAKDAALLDAVDAALSDRTHSQNPAESIDDPGHPERLDEMLREGGSMYQVRADRTGLERRLDGTVTDVVKRAMDSAPEPGRHLKAAWDAAYAVRPDASRAYAESVKAVEAALIPLVLPSDGKATLGKVLGHLRHYEDQWELAIADGQGRAARIEPLVSLATLLWEGHRDRHSGTTSATQITAEAAMMALHGAAAIVQWTVAGALRRTRTAPPDPGSPVARQRRRP